MRVLLSALIVPLALLAPGDGCDPPEEECLQGSPLPHPSSPYELGGGLDGFDSPYLGHTGSWDGKGGGIGGSSKNSDMDTEVRMGLRWTFMPVYWNAMEPDGPVDLSADTPEAWAALDAFVVQAHARGLNILMQAPVMGGNAGAPPLWAGLREDGKSAPENMAAAATFAGQLARRYRPGGTLPTSMGWGESYGVRAWEIDNEPDTYKTHWDDQAGDYAEFVTLVAGAIRDEDPQAVVIAPGVACCGAEPWVIQALDAYGLEGSPTYQAAGIPYSIGPETDVVGFHVYEGMNDTTVDCAADAIRQTFEGWEDVRGFEYARKTAYWHTEGNFDFFHLSEETTRTRWFWQFFTRGFAAGVHKLNVMDATGAEELSIQTYVSHLSDPFPMVAAEGDVQTLLGQARVFRHADRDGSEGTVWVLWAQNGGGDAEVQIPINGRQASLLTPDGIESTVSATNGMISIQLSGDAEMSEPVMVVDRP